VTSWFRSIRLGDALSLRAFPILEIFYAERDRVADDLIRVVLLLGALSMLFAHIFAFNDLTDLDADAAHPHKAPDTFTRRLSRRSMKALVVALMALASFAGARTSRLRI
jgi:4-hydroxybenzoate polyprenyltransferase